MDGEHIVEDSRRKCYIYKDMHSDTSSKMQEMQTELDELAQIYDNLGKRYQQLQGKAANSDTEMQQIQTQLLQKQQSYDSLNEEYQQLQEKAADSDTKMQQIQTQLIQQQQSYDSLNEEYQQLREKVPGQESGRQNKCGISQTSDIDDLQDFNMPSLRDMHRKSVADIFRNAVSNRSTESEETEEVYFKKRLRVKGLIIKCVQSALSVVRNKDGNRVREMQRVALVRKLLHQDNEEGQNSFIQGICSLLSKILQDIESKKSAPDIAKNWIVAEEDVFDDASKARTFRRSCLQVLEGRVTPILAEIIAYLDTNENLSILEDSAFPWKQDLWLSCLNRIELNTLQNEEMTPTKHTNLQVVEVSTTGCEGQVFSARMPFSWVIMQKITDIFEIGYSKEGSYEPEVKVLANDDIGSLLASIIDEQSVEESVQEYIEDFVHTVYCAESETEHELIAKFLHKDVNRRLQEELPRNSLLHRIVHVHIKYKTNAKILNCFRSINIIWTACSSEIMRIKNTKPYHYIFKEDLTFSALKLLIGTLTPTHDDYSTRRDEWLENVQRCRPVVEKTISIYKELLAEDYVHEAKKMWSNVLVIKLCLEHLFTDSMDRSHIASLCTSLWNKLQNTDLKKSLTDIEEFLEQFSQYAMEEHGDALLKMQDSQKRGIAFFMQVVSQICFDDNTCPSKEVIQTLLSYVFFTTPEQYKRTQGLDLNPALRSLLLQFLTRSSEEVFIENLRSYFGKAENYIKEDETAKADQYVNLSVLVIQCLEDMFTLKASKNDADDVSNAKEALTKALASIRDNDFVNKMYGIANARVGLAALAKALSERTYITHNRLYELSQTAQHLFNGTGEDTKIHHVRKYLVKVICRTYGVHTYQDLFRFPNPSLEWIKLSDIKKDGEVPDRYVLCGKNYTIVRESVAKVVLGANVDIMKKAVKDISGTQIEMMLQLAIHREVTCSNLYPQEKRNVVPQSIEHLQMFINSLDAVKDKALLQAILHNNLKPTHLVVKEGADLRQQGIQSVVMHFMAAMAAIANVRVNFTLLQPLKLLMENPEACSEMFLPTMPEVLEELKEMVPLSYTNAEQQLDYFAKQGGRRFIFYCCPNGHPYGIGEFGRTYSLGKCKICGAQISSTGQKLIETNVKDAEAGPMKEKGHILGAAGNRFREPQSQRTLNPSTCAILRLFVHLSMYIGARNNPMGLGSIISPAVEDISIEDFVWAHIEQDIADIKKALEHSEDDVFLLMHTVIIIISEKYTKRGSMSREVCQLNTKKERQKWEEDFFTSFLQESLERIEILLDTNITLIAGDERLGGNPLLQLLYEVDIENKKACVSSLQNNPKVWRFSRPISIASLRQEVMSLPTDRHVILQLFLKEEHHLRALRYIPSILRLHRILINKYKRRLDKGDASQITVAQLTSDSHSGDETKRLTTDFAEAWGLVHNSLRNFNIRGVYVHQETINDKTPISVLLPTTTDEKGLCSYALLQFLFGKQNDFLNRFLSVTGRSTSSIKTVNPKDVTSADLISYDPQHDIETILMANCQYSFEEGTDTNIDYDLTGIERQLIDRLFLSKSIIDMSKMIQIDQMVYRADYDFSEAFKKLSGKIQQEVLGTVPKNQICSEIVSLPDLCQSLNNLDITISFLTYIGGKPETNLHAFMSETLQMDTTIHNIQVRESCEFRHIKSLWLLLSHQKSKMLTVTSVSGLHDDLPADLKLQLREYTIRKLSIEKLSQLLDVLHEFILLVVAVKQTPDDKYDVRYWPPIYELQECLKAYPGFDESQLLQEDLDDFPTGILYNHSVCTWMYAFEHLGEKQKGLQN